MFPFLSSPQGSSGASTGTTEYDSTSSGDFDDELLNFDGSPIGRLAQPLLKDLLTEFFARYSPTLGHTSHDSSSADGVPSDVEERNSSGSSQRPSNTGGKRKACSDGGKRQGEPSDGNYGEKEDGSEERSPKRLMKEPPASVVENFLWACPFHKWKPLTYYSCQHSILSGINRVKQHLRRKHKRPLHCPSCWLTFEKESPFYAHIARRDCDRREGTEPEGVTTEQQTLLERRVDKKLSKEEQWYSIYEALFPGKPKPNNPYIENGLSTEFLAFQTFMATTGLSIVEQRAREYITPSLMPHQEDVLAFSQNLFQQAIPEILQRYETSRPARNNSPDSGYASFSQINLRPRPEALFSIYGANEPDGLGESSRDVLEPPRPDSNSPQQLGHVANDSLFPLQVDVTDLSSQDPNHHQQDSSVGMADPSSLVTQSGLINGDENFTSLFDNIDFNTEWWTRT